MQPQSQSFMGIYVQVWVLWDAVQQAEGADEAKSHLERMIRPVECNPVFVFK